MEAPDGEGKPRLWLAPFDRRSPPRQIPGVEGRSAHFGPSGEIFFRYTDGSSEFFVPCSTGRDGTSESAGATDPYHLTSVSPDGRWIAAWAPLPGKQIRLSRCFRSTVVLRFVIGSNTALQWSSSGDIAVDLRWSDCRWPDLYRSAAAGQNFASDTAERDFAPSRKSPGCLERVGSMPQARPVRPATSTRSSAAPSSGISTAFQFHKGPPPLHHSDPLAVSL